MSLIKYKLGDIADIIGGVAYLPNDICSDGIRVLRGGNIQSQTIELKNNDIFLPIEYKNVSNQILFGDTILVASTGSIEVLGKAATCFTDMPNTQIGAFLRIVRPKHQKFAMLISIAITSSYFHNYIKAQSKGTSINNINIGHLKNFEIPIAFDDALEHISQFYYSIQQKIAINRAINHNLPKPDRSSGEGGAGRAA
jgi:type I restriction enzyme S subunit